MSSGSIAVVIPAHNAADFIREAVTSVLEQTRPPKCIYVVDDGSDDQTSEIVLSFGSAVRLIRNETNRGRGASCNEAVSLADADYIAFLDADDVWVPEHLETLAGLLDQWGEAALAFARTQHFGASDEVWPWRVVCEGKPCDVFLELLRGTFLIPSSCMIRRCNYEAVGGFDPVHESYRGRAVLADDYDLFLRLALRAPYIGTMAVTTRYRTHAGQSSVYRAPQMIASMRYIMRLLERLPDEERWRHQQAMLEDRVSMQWEEILENAWSSRAMDMLRSYVRFGLSHHLFRHKTWRYLVRAAMPKRFMQWHDR